MGESTAAALRAQGIAVEVAATGRDGLRLASSCEPDVVVLDLDLPDTDGAVVCRYLRRWFLNPIVVLGADRDENREVAVLDAGADDYVHKPVSVALLLAHLRVAMRHCEALTTASAPVGMVIGDLYLDVAAHTARLDGETMRLARKEFALLSMLSRNCGCLLTHDRLVSHIWGTAGPAKIPALRVLVTQLRNNLGEGPGRPRLVTVPGLGYRLEAPDGADGAKRAGTCLDDRVATAVFGSEPLRERGRTVLADFGKPLFES